MMCMTCKIAIALTFLVLVSSPAHFCVLAADRSSEIEGKISGEEKNKPTDIPPELIT